MRVATDIGGTFTDLVYFEYDLVAGKPKEIKVAKTDTTPDRFEAGVMNALNKAGIKLEEASFFAHGTTVVINAITERKGAKTALVTTKGFRDVLEIARCNRPDLFNFNFIKQPPFVPRYLRMEVSERMNYKGEIFQPLDTSSIPAMVEILRKEGVEAIAVALLHAYKNPEHEVHVLEEIKKAWPEVEVLCSHHVTREWREYERTSSTVFSAYVLPLTKKYLNHLEHELKNHGFRGAPYIMQSNGGITTVDDVKSNPISIVESGPTSGVFGAIALGNKIGKKNLIVLDIGGTTAKCALVENGQVKISTTYKVEHSRTQAGYPIQVPIIDIVEIGNGGGSIAWVDQGNKLHVGPQSAGASPGPAAYGRGGHNLTTTDANIITGRIHPDYFIGGEQRPDYASIDHAAEALCKTLHVTKEVLAKGIIKVANANMINALKLVSVNKGYDPRDFSMVAIGGGGGMHGADLIKELNITELIIPAHAGVFSAVGMLMSDLRRDYIRTHVMSLSEKNRPEIEEVFSDMKHRAIENYRKDKYNADQIKFQHYMDLRYDGQEHYVKVEFPDFSDAVSLDSIITAFHQAHKKQYTFSLDNTVELVNFHLVAQIEVDKPDFPELKTTRRNVEEAVFGTQKVDFDDLGIHEIKFYNRGLLEPGMKIKGPAIVAEKASTSVVMPCQKLEVDLYGNLIIIPQ